MTEPASVASPKNASSAAALTGWLGAINLPVLGGFLAGLGALLVLLITVGGARLDAPTIGLTIAAATLILCLRALFNMARALSQPSVFTEFTSVGARGEQETQRGLREERRRLLSALKELKFDYELGKLSTKDYKDVRTQYELRVIEVMRALDREADLHPDLVRDLVERGLIEGHSNEAEASSSEEANAPSEDQEEAADDAVAEVSSSACAECGQLNDADAKFCKQCGAVLASADAAPTESSEEEGDA